MRERLDLLLAPLPAELHVDIVTALQDKGKLLSSPSPNADPPRPAGMWGLLTMLVAQYVSPDIDPAAASCVGLAVECLICALDLLDDVEDNDQTLTLQALGVARTLNVSTALMLLAQQALASLVEVDGTFAAVEPLLQATLREAVLVAVCGQHADLLAEGRAALDLTEEECIDMAEKKAGALMSMACHLGALCAGASGEVCKTLAEVGELLGTAHQFDNDSHDLAAALYPPPHNPASPVPPVHIKTDLVRGKKTLPVVLAARYRQGLQERASSADEERQVEMHALDKGIMATWSLCLYYREVARSQLQALERQRAMTPELRLLLSLDEEP